MNKKRDNHNLTKSEIIREIPLACSDELAAVEFFEKQRWGDTPYCVSCGSVDVYKMVDAKTGDRNKRYLWRCRDCKQQYTVRIGTVYEESRIPLRHWAYAFWRACTSKKGRLCFGTVSAMRNQLQVRSVPDEPHPVCYGLRLCISSQTSRNCRGRRNLCRRQAALQGNQQDGQGYKQNAGICRPCNGRDRFGVE